MQSEFLRVGDATRPIASFAHFVEAKSRIRALANGAHQR